MKFGRVWWGEDEELDNKELHGEEPDWIESGYDDNNNDKDDIQLQKSVWFLGTGNAHKRENDWMKLLIQITNNLK